MYISADMRSLAIICVLIPSAGFAQSSAAVQTWAKDHFGLQMELPARSTAQNFARVALPDGTFIYQPSGPSRLYNDPSCKPWSDAYAITSFLPKGTWLRVAVNLWEHYPTSTTFGPLDYERFQNAITNKLMFPNLPANADGMNILWILAPGVPVRDSANDGWSDNPRTRDWFLPVPANRPPLRQQAQSFITAVNNFATDRVRTAFPNGTITTNFVSRIGFQIGNEPGAGHPGGSTYKDLGIWTGSGQVLEDTTNGLMFRPDNSYTRYLSGGTSWTNPLNLPAFSFLTESLYDYNVTYKLGTSTPASIQKAGASTPGLTEMFTYYDEVFGPNKNFGWAAQCNRRSVHFRSPHVQWVQADGLRASSIQFNANSTLNGRWETAAEYAKRWADEATMVVNGYLRLPMPGNSPIIDFTECYLTYNELNSLGLWPGNYNFKTAAGAPKTEDQIRTEALALGSTVTAPNGTTVAATPPPSRISILAAIRDELYTRTAQGKLTNLGRIFWVNGYTPDPRRETGFYNTDPIQFYQPWNDFKLTTNEIKTLYGLL